MSCILPSHASLHDLRRLNRFFRRRKTKGYTPLGPCLSDSPTPFAPLLVGLVPGLTSFQTHPAVPFSTGLLGCGCGAIEPLLVREPERQEVGVRCEGIWVE